MNAPGRRNFFLSLFDVFRRGTLDETTADGRAAGRLRRMVWAMAASSGARAVSMATGLIAVPLTYGYLGVERYGLWVVISSLSMALNFADLGLGNSLVTTLAEAHGRGDRASARRQVSTAFFLFSGIAVTLVALFWLAYPRVDWAHQFNVTSPSAAAEIGPALWSFVLCLVAGLAAGIVSRVELAHQNGFVNGLWQAIGSIAALVALIVAMKLHAGLAGLVIALVGVPVLATTLQGLLVFFHTRPWLRPSWSWVSRDVAFELLRLGSGYVVVQLAMALAMYSDNIVTTQVLGPTSVAQYSVAARPFALITATLFMAMVPMWPAYTEALAKADFAWVRRTLNRSMAIVLALTCGPGLLLVAIGQPLLRLWVRDPAFVAPTSLLMALTVWTLIQGVGSVWAALLNAMRIVRFQAICAVVTSVIALGAKIYFAKHHGVAGLVWGTALSYLAFTIVPMGLYLRFSLAQRIAQGADPQPA